MSKEMVSALNTLEEEKGIKKEVVIDALEAALVSAYKRNYDQAQNVDVDFDEKRAISMYMQLKKLLKMLRIVNNR